ncbi:MAG: hypothetical protein IKW76_08005, partial [Clostridia bacterium]|nr:hypothetical protein [Clostridia bacterium]
VRGHRVSNEEKAGEIRVVGDALRIQPSIVAPIVAAPILFVLFVGVMVRSRRAERRRRARKEVRTDDQT